MSRNLITWLALFGFLALPTSSFGMDDRCVARMEALSRKGVAADRGATTLDATRPRFVAADPTKDALETVRDLAGAIDPSGTIKGPVYPQAHTEVRKELNEVVLDNIEAESNALKQHFTSLPEYDEGRVVPDLVIGSGAAGIAALYQLEGQRGSPALCLNAGDVPSADVFAHRRDGREHMTANLLTVNEFPDLVNNYAIPNPREYVGLKDNSYVSSGVIGETMNHTVARNASKTMFGANVKQVIPRRLVELARELVAMTPAEQLKYLKAKGLIAADAKEFTLNQELTRLAKEDPSKWPRGGDGKPVDMMVVAQFGKDGKEEKFFSNFVANFTGLGKPTIPFKAGSPSHEITTRSLNEIREQIQNPQAPKKGAPPVHEASAFFQIPDEQVREFMNTDRVAIVGGGYSSLVVIDRMLAAKPNLKQPIQVLVGSAQDPVKDSVFREYVDFINSDAFVKNVTDPKVEPQPFGRSVVTVTDASGKKQTFTYASDKVVVREMRDTLGKAIPGKFYLAILKDKPVVEVVHYNRDVEIAEGTGDNRNPLKITYTRADGGKADFTGRLLTSVGQETSFYQTMYGKFGGAAVKPVEQAIRGDVNFGFRTPEGGSTPPVEATIGIQTTGIQVPIGTIAGSREPVRAPIDLGGATVVSGGVASKRERQQPNQPSVVDPGRYSPNTSPDSLSYQLPTAVALGKWLADRVPKWTPKYLSQPWSGKRTSLGKLDDYRSDSAPVLMFPDDIPLQPTPKHLKDMKASDAPSIRILNEAIALEATKAMSEFQVSASGNNESRRLKVVFIGAGDKLQIHVDGVQSDDQATVVRNAFAKNPALLSNIEARIRASGGEPLVLYHGFDAGGNPAKELTRINTPIAGLADAQLHNLHQRNGQDIDGVMSYLPRNVRSAGRTPEEIKSWVGANVRELFAISNDQKIDVEMNTDKKTGKTVYAVHITRPGVNGAPPTRTAEFYVSRYDKQNRAEGLNAITGAVLMDRAGLGKYLGVTADRAAQSLEGRVAGDHDYVFWGVYKKRGNGYAAQDLTQLRAFQPQFSKMFAEVHSAEKTFGAGELSPLARNWADQQIRTASSAANQRDRFAQFFLNPRWSNKMAHGDPRLAPGHVIVEPATGKVRLSGNAQVVAERHPLEDLQIFLSEARRTAGGNRSSYLDFRDRLVADYAREMGFDTADTATLQAWVDATSPY